MTKNPNKHLLAVIGIILALTALSMGFITERILTQHFYPVSIIVPFIALVAGVLLKKNLSWFSTTFGIGMLMYLIGTVI